MKARIYILLLFIILISCNEDELATLNINNPKIKAALEKRKADYATEIMRNCRQDVMSKAENYVDSLISADINFRLNDSIIFPDKPLRPEWPGDIIVSDTIKAKKLFER
ncbi:MAG: hypothetical protein IPL55_20635 [Saprospiraceae bacterium]|jgi:PBP1b-binding outer membrane lipoprotein LpoB|nr:hypothetical protein [Saprospiraceae bacterium]MBL0026562.1 hypothetical protein [Saprospiraceae bacterium]